MAVVTILDGAPTFVPATPLGPATTFWGFLDDVTPSPLVSGPGLDQTKVPLQLATGDVRFARWTIQVAASGDTLDTKIGSGTNSGTTAFTPGYGGRIIQAAVAPRYLAPTTSAAGTGNWTWSNGVTGWTIDYYTGIVTFTTTGANRIFNFLVWYK
jgi:hypothetical protein